MSIRKHIFLFLFLLLGLVIIVQDGAYAESSLEERIISQVAGINQLSAETLLLSNLELIAFDLTGATIYHAKAVDITDGQIYALAVNENGELDDFARLKAAEDAAYFAQYGRLEPKLYEQLQEMVESEVVTVAVWLQMPEPAGAARPDIYHDPDAENGPTVGLGAPGDATGSDKDEVALIAVQTNSLRTAQVEQRAAQTALRAANTAQIQSQIAAVQLPFLAEMSAAGFEAEYISLTAPLVYLNLDKATVEALDKRADIDTIYGPNENADLMDIAGPTMKADIVDNRFGFDGTGIELAILEDSRIEFANPYLVNGLTRIPGDANVDNHATSTAGMAASTHSTQTGIAPGATLLSANGTTYSDSNMSAAMDWAAITQNVDIINNSWGGNTGNTNFNVHDRHLDYIVRYLWSTVTVAAGNEGNASGRVTSPGRGYNVITVGNFNDGGTLSWGNDTMSSSSSSVDPSTGMEKPEVAAAGTSITSTTMSSPWIGGVGSGTSYAAPMVAGEAALLMDRQSSLLSRPEAVKAIIMASAFNNIEGSSRLSEMDGAGGVDMHAAFRIVDEGWWNWRSVVASDFPYSMYTYAYAGETVRAVISWDSTPNAAYSSDPLQADIDLRVYSPTGSYVTGSTSFSNSYEIVEFVASTTGNYELRVNDYTFNGSLEYIGMAWWKGQNVMTPFVSTGWGTPPIGRDYFSADVGNSWNVIALRPPAGADYDLRLYDSSQFGNPADIDLLATSSYSGDLIDFAVIDSNHARNGDYYPEVRTWSGSGAYRMEWASRTADLTVGSYGPYSMSSLDVALIWDSYQRAGVNKFYALEPTSGNNDLGMALYDSDNSNSDSFYQSRPQYAAYSDTSGSSTESFSESLATSDWAGLVVFNKSGSGSFYIHVDDSAPSGQINIAGGAAAVNSTSVTLNLSAADAQTGLKSMRFSNNGISWTGWQAYNPTKGWILPAGNGPKQVFVQFMNKAGMVSAVFSDTVLLDTTTPDSSASSPNAVNTTSFMVNWTGSDSGSGIASYDIQYRVAGGPWTTWRAFTTATSAMFGPDLPLVVEQGERYQFRVRARDGAGNLESYPATPDSETFVLYRLNLPVINRP